MKNVLYLGLEAPTSVQQEVNLIHYPIIKTFAVDLSDDDLQKAFSKFEEYTHLIFTSKTAVRRTFEILRELGYQPQDWAQKKCIAVGQKTAHTLLERGIVPLIATEETAEGIVKVLKTLDMHGAHLFWPHSALSRLVIPTYLEEEKITFDECVIYDTYPDQPGPLPDLTGIDEIVFTSPSTVDAFIQIFGALPKDKTLTPIGPITARKLEIERE